MFKTCPDPIDVQDLQFKLHCRLKVFNNKELDTFPKSNSLVSCASRYGLLFVGSNTSNLQVIQVKCVENYTPKDKDISNYSRRNVPLPSRPQHICVNCDSTILAVVTERDNCPSVTFYDVLSFLKQNISIIKEVRLSSTPGTYVKEIGWNPSLPLIFTACKSDGTLGVYEIKGVSININELPAASEATCFCWSPKGKQIAVGSRNSRITQYKPDLKAVKVVNQPPLEGAHSLISLQWVSNYQFIGIYQSAEPEGTAKLIVVDAPKTGDPVYTNYEDVCYSGATKLPQFYMILQQHWNILMVASSNSTELGVLGSTGDTWTQWIISDSARAELPLSPDRQETLPVGLALDISSTRPLPWNESTIPPCPYLLILSHHGVLCFFSVVNLKEGAPSICAPPDPVSDLSGIQQFVTPVENTPIQPTESAQVPPPTVSVTPVSQATVFGAKVLTQPQPTYAAPATLFGAKPTDNKPLFGGQTTLTPIKPQQSTAQPSFGGQTFITPINKQQSGTANVTVNPAEKYSAIFSALNTPAAIPATTDNKTITIPILNIPKPVQPVEQSVAVQQNVSVTPVKPVEPPKPVANLKIKEETDVLLAQMLRDESTSLESELKALLHQGRLVNINIGSEDEKIELVTKIEYLQEFIKEIVDISIGENAEVHYLKQNLIQSWAWYEEARSRYNASKDETVSLLLRSQPLDSATEKKQADIRKMMYYIESQITQASKALDEQWDNFQDYAKKVHRTKMPTMEAIFQAMVRQNVILQKQCYVLKDIAGRLKGRGRAPNVPSLLLSIENTKDLEDSLNRLKIEHPQDIHQMQYQRVINRMKNLSETKTNKLRNLLKNREVFHITAAKPQLSSSLMLQSPESKSKRLLSNLATAGTPLSPLSVTAPVPKALSFAHSTPIRETKPEIKPIEALPSTTQTDAKLFTFKKAEKSNLTATTNTFIPLSKSASVFSNLPQEGLTQAPLATHTPSAFVPTQVFGGGSKFSFTSTTTTTASATRTAPVSATPAPTYSFAAASSTLPKFSAPTTPKTPDAATSLPKPSLPQFSFGAGLTIAPVGAIKKDVTTTVAANTPTFGSAATTKPSFSFGGTSSLFGAKAAAGASPSPQATVTTTGNLFFTQINKPPSDTATSTPSSTFGMTANMPKLSAFSAVTTGASNAVKNEDLTQTKPSAVTSTFTTDAGLTKSAATSSSFYGFGEATAVAKPTLTGADSTKLPASSAIVAPSVFGTAAAKPLYQTSSASSTTTEVTSIKQSSTFSTPSTTAPISTISSGTLAFNVTTSTSTKPITSPTSSAGTGASTPSLFFGGAQSVSSTVPSSTVSSSNTPSATTKPPVFGLATAIPQTTLATPASSSQLGFSVGSPQLQETSTSGGVSQTASGTAVTVTQLPIFGANKSTVSGDGTTTQPVFGSAKTTSAQPSVFGGAQNTTSGVSTGTQPTSLFGDTKTTATSQPSVFDSAVTSSQPSIFGGSQSTTSGVSTATQPTSAFGAGKTVVTSQPSVFSSAVTSSQPSIFGGSQSTTSGVSTATQPTPIFGVGKTVVTSQPSIFSSAITSSQPSIFGGSQSTTSGVSTTPQPTPIFGAGKTVVTSQPSIFSSPVTSSQPSIFGGSQSTTSGVNTVTQSTSIFGSGKTVATSQPSIFGSAVTSAQPSVVEGTQSTTSLAGTTTQPASIFGPSKTVPTSQPSVFGSAVTSAQPAIFGGGQSTISGVSSTTPTTSIFNAGNTPTQSTVFSVAAPSTKPSIFGSSTTAKTTAISIFGNANTTTTQSSIFAIASTSSSANPSIFGATSASNQSSLFGTNQASNTQQGSIFGGAASASSAPIFGSAAETSPAQPSIFGGVKATSTTKPSIFGAPQTSTSQNSIFGGSTVPPTQTPIFGAPSTSATSPFSSGFGTTSTLSSPFGQTSPGFGVPKTTTSTFSSGFGSPTGFGATPSTTSSIFGQPASFGNTATSVFGTPTTATNMFGSSTSTFGANTSANVFGPAASSSFSFAGTPSNATNTGAFGFGGLNVGSPVTTNSVFGGGASFGQATAANPFGRTTEQKSPFGGGSTSIFGNAASSSGSVFGSNTGSTFSSNTQGGFGTSGFGSPSTFGQQSTFGQSSFGNTSFGSPQPGPFSGGSGAVAQTGFGSPQSFAKPSGFGSSPVFGGSPQPAFGAAPSFGGAPAFGAAPAFGSPNKIFGGNTPTASFGSASTGNAGFGNLANQNTVGFGNLAQQAASQNSAPFSGSSSFSTWR